MNKEEAWAVLKATSYYYEDEYQEAKPEERHMMIMNDTWGWACADGFYLTDENVVRVAMLFVRYGHGGLLYFQHKDLEGGKLVSEFTDINRHLQFVINEERIREELPGSGERAYTKRSYTIDGELKT